MCWESIEGIHGRKNQQILSFLNVFLAFQKRKKIEEAILEDEALF